MIPWRADGYSGSDETRMPALKTRNTSSPKSPSSNENSILCLYSSKAIGR